jgi:hypothetical protein
VIHNGASINYQQAIEWIAHNDETDHEGACDPETVAQMVTVKLVADLSGRAPIEVATDVCRIRGRYHASRK